MHENSNFTSKEDEVGCTLNISWKTAGVLPIDHVDVFCRGTEGQQQIQTLLSNIKDKERLSLIPDNSLHFNLNTELSTFGVFLGSTTTRRYQIGQIINSNSEIGKLEICLVPVDILGNRCTPVIQSIQLKPL